MSDHTPNDGGAPVLPTRERRRRGPLVTTIVVVAVVVVAAAAIVITTNRPGSGDPAPAAAGAASSAPARTVTIGIADVSQPYWETFVALAQERLNVTVELVNFADYSQPNPALSQDQLDLNQFQHLQYLANYNVTSDDDLQPIGATAIYPLPLYSLDHDEPADLPAGASVAIPNDAVNEARGLLVLQSAGLLELRDGGTAFSTIDDVVSAEIEIQPIDASQTATALQNGSVEAAIVNKNYAIDAGLTQAEAIAQDDPASASAEPYVNAFVARAADATDPVLIELAALYHDPAVEEQVQEANGGTAVFQTWDAARLQQILASVEADAAAAQ